jgi:hypothetical protein
MRRICDSLDGMKPRKRSETLQDSVKTSKALQRSRRLERHVRDNLDGLKACGAHLGDPGGVKVCETVQTAGGVRGVSVTV